MTFNEKRKLKFFKKSAFILAIMFTLAGTLNNVSAITKGFDIKVDGKQVVTNKNTGMPYISGNRTLVPIRVISENMGYQVEWNEQNRQVVINGKQKVILTIDSNTAIVGNKKVPIDSNKSVVAKINNDNRTYVPLRFVAENMGAKVEYKQDAKYHYIIITLNGGNAGNVVQDGTKPHDIPGNYVDNSLAQFRHMNDVPKGTKNLKPNPGKVSKNWIDPHIKIGYVDLFNNKYGMNSEFGLIVQNEDLFKGKDPNKYYMDIQMIDPFLNTIELYNPDTKTRRPLGGNNVIEQKVPLDTTNMNTLVGQFAYTPFSPVFQTYYRTVGEDAYVGPRLGQLLRYRVTIHQNGEVHAYEFDVPYFFAAHDETLTMVFGNKAEDFKHTFKQLKLYLQPNEDRLLGNNPINWTQIY